jgi:hypothetical protein
MEVSECSRVAIFFLALKSVGAVPSHRKGKKVGPFSCLLIMEQTR